MVPGLSGHGDVARHDWTDDTCLAAHGEVFGAFGRVAFFVRRRISAGNPTSARLLTPPCMIADAILTQRREAQRNAYQSEPPALCSVE